MPLKDANPPGWGPVLRWMSSHLHHPWSWFCLFQACPSASAVVCGRQSPGQRMKEKIEFTDGISPQQLLPLRRGSRIAFRTRSGAAVETTYRKRKVSPGRLRVCNHPGFMAIFGVKAGSFFARKSGRNRQRSAARSVSASGWGGALGQAAGS